MGAAGLLKAALLGALACLLSACWMSEKPIIGDREAVAVDFAGSYRSEGEEGPTDLTVVSTGATSYELTNGNREEVPARFVALQPGWYLMQGMGHSDEEGAPPYYLYFVVRQVGGELHIYSPNCEDVPGKFKGLKREAMQYAQSDDEPKACNFSRLDGLKKMALAYIARIEKGELSGEPQVFERTGS